MLRWILLLSPLFATAQPGYENLKSGLRDIQTLTGKWNVETRMISRAGKEIHEKGTFVVSWALDSTYLRWEASLGTTNGRSRSYLCLVGFDPDSSFYNLSFFYSRTSFKVFEKGTFHAKEKTFSTTTEILQADGGRESIRTLIDMSDRNRLLYRSFSRLPSEKEELLDFEAVMIRMK